MKKKICLLITIVLALFAFSGKVNAIAMYMECNYADYCTSSQSSFWDYIVGFVSENSGWHFFDYNLSNANVYVPLTDGYGNVKVYAITSDGADYFILENEYETSYGNGCWLRNQDGYGNFFVVSCNSSNAFDYSNQTINISNTCPACLIPQKGFNFWEWSDTSFHSIIPSIIEFYNGYSSESNWEYVPVGTGSLNSSSNIENSEYIVYEFINSSGQTQKIAEGYIVDNDAHNGAYAFVGPNIYKVLGDDILYYQLAMINKFYNDDNLNVEDFWKVHENFESLMITSKNVNISNSGFWDTAENVCQNGYEDCKNNHGFKILIDSNDSNGNIANSVKQWFEKYNAKLNELSGIVDISNNTKLIDTCSALNNNSLNGKSYEFNTNYTVDNLVDDLEKAYDSLELAYSSDFSFTDCGTGDYTVNASGSATSCLYTEVLDILEIKDIAVNKSSDRYYLNETFLVEAIYNDVDEAMNSYLKSIGDSDTINVLNASSKLNEYVLLFYTTVSYLDSSNSAFGIIDSDLSDRIENLRNKFEILVKVNELDLYPVVDCKGLLGQDLIDKINSYLDIIKIVIPIILIGFGVMDFTKAIFGGEDDMKKAQKSFFTRIAIAVIIFLTPTIVNLLLNLANQVWPIIQPSSCGIFK